MRRVAISAAVLLVLAAVTVLARNGGGVDAYRVDAIFDTAKSIVPGQSVKIAGARVGRVDGVELAPGPRARVSLSVDGRFAPFRADARCRILPNGVISGNYVDCDPGTPSQRPLAPRQGVPTVAVDRTTVPLSFQDLLEVFSVPVSDRVGLLLDSLGVATAGRGNDINAILRRANPTLTEGRRVLTAIASQRDALADATTQTRRVLATLAARRKDVRRFVTAASDVAGTAGSRARRLTTGVQRLPAMLTELRRSFSSIDTIAQEGTPALDRLRASAPELRSLTRALPRFTSAGTPGVKALGSALRASRRELGPLANVTRHLHAATETGKSTVPKVEQLLTDLRRRGGVEGLTKLIYGMSAIAGGYDSISHFVLGALAFYPQCFRNFTAPGCDHRYTARRNGTVPVNDPSGDGDDATAPRLSDARIRGLLDYLLK